MKIYDLKYFQKIFLMYQLRDIFWLAGATQKFVYIKAWVYIACLIVLSTVILKVPFSSNSKKMNILFASLLIFAFYLSIGK